MYAYCQDMPGVTEETSARVDAEVGDAPVPGLIAHVAGPMRGGWRIVDIWESEEAAQRFQVERLGPAVQRATAGAPTPSLPFDLYEVRGSASQSRLGQVSYASST